jgi:hypothetical protein
MSDDEQFEDHVDDSKAEAKADQDSSEQEEGKAKVYKEEVKDQQTTHWDMDYMTQAEIDEAYEQGQENKDEDVDRS